MNKKRPIRRKAVVGKTFQKNDVTIGNNKYSYDFAKGRGVTSGKMTSHPSYGKPHNIQHKVNFGPNHHSSSTKFKTKNIEYSHTSRITIE